MGSDMKLGMCCGSIMVLVSVFIGIFAFLVTSIMYSNVCFPKLQPNHGSALNTHYFDNLDYFVNNNHIND